jgi:hypothetical protein
MEFFRFIEALSRYWTSLKGLIISIIFIIVTAFVLEDFFYKRVKLNPTVFYGILILLTVAIIIYWLIDNRKINLPKAKKTLRLALIINVDEEEIVKKVLKIVKPVVKEINSSKSYANIYIDLLPINTITHQDELSGYLDRNEYSMDTLIYLKIQSGKQNNTEKFVINDFYFTGKFPNGIKRVYEDSINIIEDISIRNNIKNWEYIESNSYDDKIKLSSNLKDLILHYSGIYLIMQSKEESAVEILRGLHNKGDSVVKGKKDKHGKVEIKITPQNVVAGRFTYTLVNLLVQVGFNSYLIEKDRLKSIKYLTEVESIFNGNPLLAHIYVPLAKLWYEQGNLNLSKEYTKKLEITNQFPNLLTLNKGFYAIIENDPKRFILNYKKFLNTKDLGTNEILIIDFLNNEKEKYPNSFYLFELAEAILTKLYIDSLVGDKLLKDFFDKHKDNHNYKDLKALAIQVLRKKIQLQRRPQPA